MTTAHTHEPASSTRQRPASLWLDEPLPAMPPLVSDTTCDVCIVGGGIAGLLTAQRLAERGRRVVVLDMGQFAAGETGHTTAHFTTALDDRYTELERLHGRDGARMGGESHAAAIAHIESLVRTHNIECGWTRLDGYLTVPAHHHEQRADLLDHELAACGRAGVLAQRIDRLPAPWPDMGAALRFPDQAQLHPLRLLRGVAEQLVHSGAKLHERTHVTKINGGKDAHVETEAGPVVRCDHIIVATNTPVNTRVSIHTKQAGYQTYVVAFHLAESELPPLLLWDGLWEDDVSYHYVRLMHGSPDASGESAASGGNFLIVGGEDHKTGQGPDGDEPYRCIESWTRRHFPQAGRIVRRWSGEVMEPADGLGFIGKNPTGPDNVYIVTGDSGNGMTHGTIAALLIPELIDGRKHAWESLYSPARKVGVHGIGKYLKENVNTAAQYRDWFARGDVVDESKIAPGSGAIIVKGLKHLAVYKDPVTGRCSRMSATCPHLGGIVRWNSQEQTWDCPCHASRFDRNGRVLHGPANSDLKPEE